MPKASGKSDAEARQDYQARYYRAHIEKAKEYQIAYNREHYKPKKKKHFEWEREAEQLTFNASDLMHSHGDKTVKMLKQVLSGERLFTM